jgi:hypothetical protein
MSMTFGEWTSRKSSASWVWSLEIVQRCGKIHMDKGRVGEESKGKETDGHPLTLGLY